MSNEPGLTGWISHPLCLRAYAEKNYYTAQKIERPDAAHAFYIALPKLTWREPVILEVYYKNKWQKKFSFTRQRFPVQNKTEAKDFQKKIKKAVLVHAAYPEILQEYEVYFKQLKDPVDFYLNISQDSPMHQAYARGWSNAKFYKKILINESRGRDLMGFLSLLAFILEQNFSYDAILFLHTKKSPQFPTSEGRAWRHLLVMPLMQSSQQIDLVLYQLFQNQEYQLAGSETLIQFYEPILGRDNYFYYEWLCNFWGLPLRGTEFVAGTMFWMKFLRLKEFFTPEKLKIAIERLEYKTTDNSFAHAWERFIGLLATFNDSKILAIDYNKKIKIEKHSHDI